MPKTSRKSGKLATSIHTQVLHHKLVKPISNKKPSKQTPDHNHVIHQTLLENDISVPRLTATQIKMQEKIINKELKEYVKKALQFKKLLKSIVEKLEPYVESRIQCQKNKSDFIKYLKIDAEINRQR